MEMAPAKGEWIISVLARASKLATLASRKGDFNLPLNQPNFKLSSERNRTGVQFMLDCFQGTESRQQQIESVKPLTSVQIFQL